MMLVSIDNHRCASRPKRERRNAPRGHRGETKSPSPAAGNWSYSLSRPDIAFRFALVRSERHEPPISPGLTTPECSGREALASLGLDGVNNRTTPLDAVSGRWE